MKKLIIFVMLTVALAGVSAVALSAKPNASADIPDQAIRLRIIANSDSQQDQFVKIQVRDELIREMQRWNETPRTLEQSRILLKRHLPNIHETVRMKLKQLGVEYRFTIQLGELPFPEKMYHGKPVPAGNYEALVITIGAGAGKNWWCVMFPPLCFGPQAPQSAQELELESEQDREPSIWIWEWLKKIF